MDDRFAWLEALGLSVNVWTVNDEPDIRSCLAAGADIVITNYPDRALRIRRDCPD